MGLLVANVGPVKKPGGVKRFVGRVARRVVPGSIDTTHKTRERIYKNYQQLHQPGQPLDTGLLARRVDQIKESPAARTKFGNGAFVISSGMLYMASILGASVLLNIDLLSALNPYELLGGMLVATPTLTYLFIKADDVSVIAVQHSVNNLVSLITQSQQPRDLAYVRGVINEPGHEDIKKQVLDELVIKYTGGSLANHSCARALVVLYDLLSDSQKQELLQHESTLSSTTQSPAKRLSIHHMLLTNANHNVDGLEDVYKQNAMDFLATFNFRVPAGLSKESFYFEKPWNIEEPHINTIIASLLRNPAFDQQTLIDQIVDRCFVKSSVSGFSEEQSFKDINKFLQFLDSLKEHGLAPEVVQKLGVKLFQKFANTIVENLFLILDTPEEYIEEAVQILIEAEAKLREHLEIDVSQKPLLATELFESIAAQYVDSKHSDFESGVVFIQEYLTAHLRCHADQTETFRYFDVEQNLIDWLDSTQIRYEMKAFMVHMITSVQNDHFNGRVYNEIVQKVDVQYWREVLLPLYSVNQAFHNRMMNAKVFHPHNAIINVLYNDMLIYNFINQLAQASSGEVANLIRSNSKLITDRRPGNIVAALIQAYQSGSLPLERAVEILKASSNLNLTFRQRLANSQRIANPVGVHTKRLAAALDPIAYTLFLVEAFPQYSIASAPYYNSPGVLDKIAKLAASINCEDREKYKAILLDGSLHSSRLNHAEALFTYAENLAEHYFRCAGNVIDNSRESEERRLKLANELARALNFITDDEHILYAKSVNALEFRLIDNLLVRTTLQDLTLELSLVKYLELRNRPTYEQKLRLKLSQLNHKKSMMEQAGHDTRIVDVLIRKYQALLA